MKKLLPAAAAAALAVAVMFFAFSYNDDDDTGVAASSTPPAGARSYIVSTVAGCCGRRPASPEEREAFNRAWDRAKADATDGSGATAGFRDL